MNRILKPLITVIVLILLLIAGYVYWNHERQYPNTDDAYVGANITQIAPQVDGRVIKVSVTDHQFVKKGDPLFEIDPSPFLLKVEQANDGLINTVHQIAAFKSAVAAAKSQVNEARAKFVYAKQNAKRILAMQQKNLASPQDADQAESQLKLAHAAFNAMKSNLQKAREQLGNPTEKNASIQQAKAALAQALLNLQYTKVSAPSDGFVDQVTLQPGANVTAYQPLFSLVSDHEWWIDANFKETQLDRMHPGEPADITMDMYPGHHFHGVVESISTGSGSTFSLLPAENATGNWVKVTQRFPVRVRLTDPENKDYPFRVGASATVTVDTTKTIQMPTAPVKTAAVAQPKANS